MDHSALIGSWRMLSWTRTAVATGIVTDALGPDPIGYIAYHEDGRMMATVFQRARPKLDGPPGQAEKADLFDTMLAYVARYSLQDGQVTHHVEAAWNPNWQIDLTRPFTLSGKRLTISGAVGTDPATGEDVIYQMEFEKV
jgi:hypothetical protein